MLKSIPLLDKINKAEIVKFGDFILKSGISTNIYFDFRILMSFPELLTRLAFTSVNLLEEILKDVDIVCGIPLGSIPFSSLISSISNKPMILVRDKPKEYGLNKSIEGNFKKGQKCLLIDDVCSTGTSIIEARDQLIEAGLIVEHVFVIMNRQIVKKCDMKLTLNLNFHSLFTQRYVAEYFFNNNTINKKQFDCIISDSDGGNFQKGMLIDHLEEKRLPFVTRAKLNDEKKLNKNVSKLFQIAHEKKTNLILAVDEISNTDSFLTLLNLVGPHIAALKLHCDMYAVDLFNAEIIKKIKKLSTCLKFLLIEDRKFSDIGNTVKGQFISGPYQFKNWVDAVTCHVVAGSKTVEILADMAQDTDIFCLLVSTLSSNPSYNKTIECKNLVKSNPNFCSGFISQERIMTDPTVIHVTPGVRSDAFCDSIDQKYNTPFNAVSFKFADFVVVGRGITQNSDPLATTIKYKNEAFSAYMSSIS
ncbi:hypothetical protein A3Q56_01825 [Intoshia linei]|uniref:Uridine 5'-monophosphate synthase n=1 Tax=Intoshia linei TaxID=1819745 RepID=A0A177B9R5_9BILA|nr:hypothetical protein A3Q56_01825 [Intoshia linei]